MVPQNMVYSSYGVLLPMYCPKKSFEWLRLLTTLPTVFLFGPVLRFLGHLAIMATFLAGQVKKI